MARSPSSAASTDRSVEPIIAPGPSARSERTACSTWARLADALIADAERIDQQRRHVAERGVGRALVGAVELAGRVVRQVQARRPPSPSAESGACPSRRLAAVASSRFLRATALVYASSVTPISPSATETTLAMW